MTSRLANERREGVILSDLRVLDVRHMGPFPERDFAGNAMHGTESTGHSQGEMEHPPGNSSSGKDKRTVSWGTCSVLTQSHTVVILKVQL